MLNSFKKLFQTNKVEENIDEDGYVEIIDDKIIVYDPINNGTPATIVIPEEEKVKVYVNGEETKGEIKVFKKDNFEFVFPNPIEQEEEFTSMVSDDKMSVFMEKSIIKGVIFGLENVTKTKIVQLAYIEKDYVFPTPLEKIKDVVIKEGYKGEWLEENIEEISKTYEKIKLPILKGKEPIKEKQPYYERLAEETELNFVEGGLAVAKFHELVPPINGMDVLGNEIIIEPVIKLASLKDGVKEENGIVYATRPGRLVFTKKEIEVIPQIIIPRDLTPEDGKLMFDEGDVWVKGAVKEGSFIRASGMIVVENGIYESTIICDSDIHIKGSMSDSDVYGGYTVMTYKEIKRNCRNYIKKLNQFIHLSEEYKGAKLSKRGDITELIHNLCFDFEKEIKENHQLYDMVEDNSYERLYNNFQYYKELKDEIAPYLETNTRLKVNEDELRKLKQKIGDFVQVIEEIIEEKGNSIIKVGSIDSSSCYASGDIIVEGLGIYLSKVESGDNIISTNGAKGSYLIAENSVRCGKFKALKEDQGILVRNPKGFIQVKKRGPYTIFQIDDYIDEVDEVKLNCYLTKREDK